MRNNHNRMFGQGLIGRYAASGETLLQAILRPRHAATRLSALAVASVSTLAWVIVAGIAPARAAEPMSFQTIPIGAVNGICGHNCAEAITAEGEITNDTASDFLQFLAAHAGEQGFRSVVLLQSPGGTVVGAMKLGMVFRKIGAAVIVAQAVGDGQTVEIKVAPGLCMSACVYAFFGGKKRVIPPVSQLGIHRMVINEDVRDPSGGFVRQQTFGSQDFVATLAGYTKLMGIDPGVIAYAEQVAPEAIHIVTPQQIARWRLGSSHM